MYKRLLIVLSVLLPGARAQEASHKPASEITLERIMGDPDWLARSPKSAYWADDGRSVYWSQKRLGSPLSDLVQTSLTGEELRRVSDGERAQVDVGTGSYARDRTRKVYTRHGDVFLKHLQGPRKGEILQLTRTSARESQPFFLVGDSRVAFRRGGGWCVHDLQAGFEQQQVVVEAGEDPDADQDEQDDSYLAEQNHRLSDYQRRKKRDRDAAKKSTEARRAADPSMAPEPIYLGPDLSPRTSALSPDGRWLAQVYGKSRERGKRDNMPLWVTESSYVESQAVRSLVGTGKSAPGHLALFDLVHGRRIEVDLEHLPGITLDPLEEIKAATRERASATEEREEHESPEAQPGGEPQDEPDEGQNKARALNLRNLKWSDDGTRLALQAFSVDHKDRWTLRLDLSQCSTAEETAEETVEPIEPFVIERRHDPAWIGFVARGLGWLPDGQLWFQSEATGYSHLYLHDPETGATRALSSGSFEVSAVEEGPLGRYLYFRANALHPGITEIQRVEIATGRIEPLTQLGGRNSARLSADGSQLLITHSELLAPPELYVQAAQPGSRARRLTHTVTEEFESLPWIEPQIVEVPNEDGRPIYSRLYLPPVPRHTTQGSPAVFFVHGAGYLQNSHQGWSNYFREFMFHSLLAHRGYVVMDMDYRASAGYGRDWRTAIYRQMGTPELADLKSGVAWVVNQHGVDASRIGIYGGSYGGFLTLMALFRAPGLFAAGAALRPVTDWAHYNHGYTSNILNTPEDDPLAYERSSPIEFADGLQDRLLICHGMLDDNVFFQDSVRLVQRLIELQKQDWEIAIFPVEPHGFRQPSSWLNEYRRILKLFGETLGAGG